MTWRNRIVGEGTVPAGELLDHPANFRRHGDAQRVSGFKHRYLLPLDQQLRDRVAPLAQPYPKRSKQAMAGDHPEQRRCGTDPSAPPLPSRTNRPRHRRRVTKTPRPKVA